MKKKNQKAEVEQPVQQNAEAEKVKAPVEDNQKPVIDQPEQQATVNKGIDAILKRYAQYESVYIDKFGFVFTVDTPENQRNNAVLYKNKYYKK